MQIVKGLFLSLLISMSVSAMARESTSSIAMSVAQKQAILKKLNASIANHQRMTLVEIKADLSAQVKMNQAHLLKISKNSKLSSDAIEKNVSQALSSLSRAQSKSELIAMEVELRDRMETSANVMLLFLKEAAANSPTGQFHGTDYLWLGFYAILDIATLPVTFVISAVTGF